MSLFNKGIKDKEKINEELTDRLDQLEKENKKLKLRVKELLTHLAEKDIDVYKFEKKKIQFEKDVDEFKRERKKMDEEFLEFQDRYLKFRNEFKEYEEWKSKQSKNSGKRKNER